MHLIRDLMTKDVTTIPSDATVTEAARALEAAGVGSLPVLDGGRPVGIVTDRDLVLRVLAPGKDPEATTAGDVVTSPLVSLSSDRSLDEAVFLMSSKRIRRLPVVDEGRLVGFLSQADIALHESAEISGLAVARISEPAAGPGRSPADDSSAGSFPASDPPSRGSAGLG